MSLNQTYQPANPGDSATDLTFAGEDQANTHAAIAQGPSTGIDDQAHGHGEGLFPGTQTADEQNLEVDVCIETIIDTAWLMREATNFAFKGGLRNRFRNRQRYVCLPFTHGA